MKKEALGVDIGNVITDHRPVKDIKDESFWRDKYSTIPASKGVFEYLKKLNSGKFRDNIFLVSRAKEEHEKRILTWLVDNDFYNKTGIKPKNVFFCRERHEKERICRENNITYFVDDRLEVLSHMVGKIPHLFLFQPDPQEVEEFKQFLPNVIGVGSWEEIMEKIK